MCIHVQVIKVGSKSNWFFMPFVCVGSFSTLCIYMATMGN